MKLTIAAYRTHATRGTQITLSQTDDNGRGWGRRLAGPKHYNSGTTELVTADLAEADAREIRKMLDTVFPQHKAEHRDQVLTEAANHLDRRADQVEVRVAEHYGAASGIGPGSADMLREAARDLRDLAARAVQEPETAR